MSHSIDPDGRPDAHHQLHGALDPDGTVRLLELPDHVGPGAPIA
jgi:hypothetical protein